MGAFCVFGVSRQVCRRKAEQTVPAWYMDGDDKRRYLSAPEWGGRVAAEAARLFEATEKVVRISPEFDAPQFCRDWIAVSPAEVKLVRIMVRGPKIGEDGKPVMRKGVAVMTWLPYVDGAAQQLPAAKAPRAPAVVA